MNFFKYTKQEKIALIVIFSALFLFMYISYGNSLMKSRDVQRKNDLRDVANSLEDFQKTFNYYPESKDGKIVGCDPKFSNDGKSMTLSVCTWGQGAKFFDSIRVDPLSHSGRNYYYLSSGTRFQIFASLESDQEAEYSLDIQKRNLPCGNKVCNFGIASGSTPLNISIDEYEYQIKLEKDRIYLEELEAKKKTKK